MRMAAAFRVCLVVLLLVLPTVFVSAGYPESVAASSAATPPSSTACEAQLQQQVAANSDLNQTAARALAEKSGELPPLANDQSYTFNSAYMDWSVGSDCAATPTSAHAVFDLLNGTTVVEQINISESPNLSEVTGISTAPPGSTTTPPAVAPSSSQQSNVDPEVTNTASVRQADHNSCTEASTCTTTFAESLDSGDTVVVSGGCPTSVSYFTDSEGNNYTIDVSANASGVMIATAHAYVEAGGTDDTVRIHCGATGTVSLEAEEVVGLGPEVKVVGATGVCTSGCGKAMSTSSSVSFAPDSSTYAYIAVGADYATPGSPDSTAGADFTISIAHNNFLQASEYSTTVSSPTSFPMKDYVTPTSWIDAGVAYTNDPQLQVQEMWAGYEKYILSSGDLVPIYGTQAYWTIPTASIPSGQTCEQNYLLPLPPYWPCDIAVWTGLSNSAAAASPIDPPSGHDLIQAGSNSEISVNDSNPGGTPTYNLWYETTPALPVTCMKANAGDSVTVEIDNYAYVGGSVSDWLVIVYDATSNQMCSGLGSISYTLDGYNQTTDVPHFAQYMVEDGGYQSIVAFTPTTIGGELYNSVTTYWQPLSQGSQYTYNEYSIRDTCTSYGTWGWTNVYNGIVSVDGSYGTFTEYFASTNCSTL